jgi:GMP synthase-like glutamine amidotransferase
VKALIVEHERATPGGLIYDWLDSHKADVDELRIDVEDGDVDPSEYDLVIPLGSEFAAFDDHVAWIPRERELLRKAVDADVSVLGICFGGQQLARELGGTSFRADVSEIGWLPVRTKDPDLVSEGPWFQWHFDTFTAPPGSSVIADSDVGPQAYVIGRSMGVQFHPEVTPKIMDDWVRVYRHELDAEGVDPDALLEQTHTRAEENRKTSWRLLDAFIRRVARLV